MIFRNCVPCHRLRSQWNEQVPRCISTPTPTSPPSAFHRGNLKLCFTDSFTSENAPVIKRTFLATVADYRPNMWMYVCLCVTIYWLCNYGIHCLFHKSWGGWDDTHCLSRPIFGRLWICSVDKALCFVELFHLCLAKQDCSANLVLFAASEIRMKLSCSLLRTVYFSHPTQRYLFTTFSNCSFDSICK